MLRNCWGVADSIMTDPGAAVKTRVSRSVFRNREIYTGQRRAL